MKIATDTIWVTIIMVTLLIIVVLTGGDYTKGINDCNAHWIEQLTPEQTENKWLTNYTVPTEPIDELVERQENNGGTI